MLDGRCQQYVFASNEKVHVGEGSVVHPTAKITGPAVIGANCVIERQVKLLGPVVIGDGCTIMEDSVIESSVIWRNARLGPMVSLKRSILADNCCLNEGSICEGSVLGDTVTVVSGGRLKPGSKIWPRNGLGFET